MKATSLYRLGNGVIINVGDEIPADMLKKYPTLKKQEDAKKESRKSDKAGK